MSATRPQSLIRVGQEVRVTRGIFSNFRGTVRALEVRPGEIAAFPGAARVALIQAQNGESHHVALAYLAALEGTQC